MKLNCDLGESFGNWQMGVDESVMPHIDMANVACGFHAGDANVMFKTLTLAKQHNVEIGAHPGYKDIEGFGRRSIPHSEQEIINLIVYQVSAILGMAKSVGTEVTYVKPHGALYNDMMADDTILNAILKAIQSINRSLQKNNETPLKLMILATANEKHHKQQALNFEVELLLEAFADRRYTDEGTLQNRKINGAVLSKSDMLEQVKTLQQTGTVITASGKTLSIAADTICVHGDNEEGVALIKDIKAICI